MKSALNARLLSAAELTRQDAIFADIGTDHAYLPLFLLEECRIKYAYCSDINKGPLDSARKNAAERNMTDYISFVLTDGASVLSDKGITDYAICGMGGELIADIIDRAPHLRDGGVNLILQPMSRQSVLRRYLASNGFEIKCESYSCDAGKYYVCMLANYTGLTRDIDESEAEIGNPTVEYRNDSARLGYLKTLYAARSRAFEGKRLGGMVDSADEQLLASLTNVITILSQEGNEK